MTADVTDTPRILELADGFYVRQAVDNIAWIDMGGFAVVVDALEQAQLEGEVFDAIEKTIGDVPIRYVLNTHTHYDHVALNPAFQRRGAEVVNMRTVDLPPEGRRFDGAKRRLLMLPLGGLHTAEDCLVWLPQDRVLFVGDLFGWGLIPLGSALTDETAERLVDAYHEMIELDPVTVVPGHGPICSADELRRWVEYFRWLRRGVADALRQGESPDDIERRLAPPQDMLGWWRFVEWKHAEGVSKVLAAVGSGRLGS